jgi:signal transduction histidine kinase
MFGNVRACAAEGGTTTYRDPSMFKRTIRVDRHGIFLMGGGHRSADPCEITATATSAKNQTFTVSIPDRTLRVEGDPTRLMQAVSNLLHNGEKYTPVRGNILNTLASYSIGHVRHELRRKDRADEVYVAFKSRKLRFGAR